MSDEGPRIVATNGGLSVCYGKLWLYSRYTPERSALRLAQMATLQSATLYIVPSPCLCYGLDDLLERLPGDSALLCVELDPALSRLCSDARAPFMRKERIAFIEAEEKSAMIDAALAAVRRLGRFRRVVKLRISQGEDMHAAAYHDLFALIEDELATYWRNKMALLRMSRLWTKNFFFNIGAMDWYRVLAAPLRSSQAVVVCGAGTSLDLALPFLRRVGSAVHIMACDTAAGALASAGVRVDSVVCLEGQVYNVADFLPLERKTCLSFLDLSAHPSSYRALKGPFYLIASRWMESALHMRFAASGLPCLEVDPLGSVGVLALSLARRLYAGPLFIAGLDFSYPQGRTHCQGSPNDIAERKRESRCYKAEGRWRASFGEGTRRLSTGFVSDPALNMYAALAKRELELIEEGRLAYDLRQGLGAVLPVRAVSFEDAQTLLASAGSCPMAAQPAPLRYTDDEERGHESMELRAKARAFLAGELSLAARLRDALKDGTDVPGLRSLVAACYYMYGHFPDAERVQELELDALKRLAAEASYWEGRLRAAMA